MNQKRIVKPDVLEREAEVVKLRRGGLTWDLIAKELNYKTASGAHAAYVRASKRIVIEDIEAIRQVESDGLGLAQAAIWRKVLTGDVPAINTFLKIQERRAKLLGLDQPIRQQVEVTTYDGDSIDTELARLVNLLADSGPTRSLDAPTSETGASS